MLLCLHSSTSSASDATSQRKKRTKLDNRLERTHLLRVYFRCRPTRLQEMEEMSSVVGRMLPAVICLLLTTPLFAHHEILAKFDSTKPQTLKGTVTKVDWTDPHVHVLMNVLEGTRLVNWAVEL